MPRRMITPELWFNEKVGSLPDAGRLLFIGIFSNADDDGRLKASAMFLKAHIFPYDDDKTNEQIKDLRDKCAQLSLIRVYNNGTQEYLDIPGWREHQQIRKDRYNPSKLPSYDEVQGKQQPSVNQVATNGNHSLVKSSLVKSNQTPSVSAQKGVAAVKEILDEVKKYLGFPEKISVDPIPSYGKEGQAIKRMLARGFTRREILDCWRSKVSQRGGEFVSMTWVNEDIGKKGGSGEQSKGQRKTRKAADFRSRNW